MSDELAVLGDELAAALCTHPQAATHAFKRLLQAAHRQAAEGDFAPLRVLADRTEAAVEALGRPDATDDPLAALAQLVQQTCVVLAYLGDSEGVRDSGYFRAALAHAERLDVMTQGTLHLVDLVNLADK
jgi:hypothetical protein